MTNPPQDIGYQGVPMVDRDTEHLRTLSICWYVAAGLGALFGCFPIFHVGLGLFMILAPEKFNPPDPSLPAAGWLFLLMGLAFMLVGWTGAVLAFVTARSLPRRRRMVVCYIAAGLACLQIPIGTILGVFTFIVLARPTVRSTFT